MLSLLLLIQNTIYQLYDIILCSIALNIKNLVRSSLSCMFIVSVANSPRLDALEPIHQKFCPRGNQCFYVGWFASSPRLYALFLMVYLLLSTYFFLLTYFYLLISTYLFLFTYFYLLISTYFFLLTYFYAIKLNVIHHLQ